jgi:hypothetical protein
MYKEARVNSDHLRSDVGQNYHTMCKCSPQTSKKDRLSTGLYCLPRLQEIVVTVATTNCCLPFCVFGISQNLLTFYFFILMSWIMNISNFFPASSLFLIQDFFQHTSVTSILVCDPYLAIFCLSGRLLYYSCLFRSLLKLLSLILCF